MQSGHDMGGADMGGRTQQYTLAYITNYSLQKIL